MFYRSTLSAAAISASLLFASHAFAQKTSIEAQVKGADGKAAAGATVQVERQDKTTGVIAGRTDASGRFLNGNLDPGTYKVTVLVAGAAPQTEVVTTAAKKPVLVKIEMKQAAAATKKIYVWVPPGTGSHMGGHFEERGTVHKPGEPGAANVENVSASAVQRQMTQNSVPSGGGR